MNKILLPFFTLFSITFCFSQAPQAISYQAISRNALGQIIPNQIIAVRFSILENSANGSLAYQETQVATTNAFGLFTLEIGGGTPTYSTFANINWGAGSKFLKTEIAPGGGANYLVQGTTQLLSVPYALYAEKTRLTAGTGINITSGNIINTNFKAGPGIRLNQDSIVGNYHAGAGININGDTISSTGNNLWKTDAAGINYKDATGYGNVGIGVNSVANTALSLFQKNTSGHGSATLDMSSDDTWQTVFRFRNLTSNQEYSFNLAGSGNIDAPVRSLGLYNNSISPANSRWILNTDGAATNYVAIGSYDYHAQTPRSRLHIFNGDININDIGSGIIMKSANGQCWRVTIDNSGNFLKTAIACP